MLQQMNSDNTLLPTTGNNALQSRKPNANTVEGRKNVSAIVNKKIEFDVVDEDGFTQVMSASEKRQKNREAKAEQDLVDSDRPGINQKVWKVPVDGQSTFNGITTPLPTNGRATQHPGGTNKHAPGPRTLLHAVRYADQLLGVIIHHTAPIEIEHDAKLADKFVIEVGGIKYTLRPQFWIIVGRAQWYVYEISIFTFNKNGLKYKPKNTWEEYLNVEPVFAPNYTPQSPTMPVLKVQATTGEKVVSRDTMIAKWTMVRPRRVDKPDIARVGQLDRASTDIAVKYAKSVIGNMPKDN